MYCKGRVHGRNFTVTQCVERLGFKKTIPMPGVRRRRDNSMYSCLLMYSTLRRETTAKSCLGVSGAVSSFTDTARNPFEMLQLPISSAHTQLHMTQQLNIATLYLESIDVFHVVHPFSSCYQLGWA